MQWYDMTSGQFIIKPQQKLPSILQGFKGHTYDGGKNKMVVENGVTVSHRAD